MSVVIQRCDPCKSNAVEPPRSHVTQPAESSNAGQRDEEARDCEEHRHAIAAITQEQMRQPTRQPRAHLHIANKEPHPAMQQHNCQNREPAQQVHSLETRRRRPLHASSVGLHSFYSNITVTIEQAYSAFNRPDIDGALALMTQNVSWPKASEGGQGCRER